MAEKNSGAFPQVCPVDHLTATAAALRLKVDRRTVAGRSRAGRLMTTVRAQLIEHVGGKPTAVQRELVERAVQLRLRIWAADQRFESARAHDPGYPDLVEAFSSVLAQLDQQRAITTPIPKQKPAVPSREPELATVERR